MAFGLKHVAKPDEDRTEPIEYFIDYIRLYQKAGYQPNILLHSNDMESILMMVAAEEGISIVPEYSHSWDVGTENVVFVPLSGEGETEEILMAWRKNDDNPALGHFIEKLQQK